MDARTGAKERNPNVSTETTTDIKHTLPRDVGIMRPIRRVQSGWWVHLNASPSGKIPAGWEQVDFSGEAAGIVSLFWVNKDEPPHGAHRDDEVPTLTEREARKHGLGVEG